MSTPNDDLPLDNRAGNAYDALFADRINALARSSGGPSTPRQPGGNGTGMGWSIGVLCLLLGLARGCASLSTSNSRSSYNYKPPDNTELRKHLEQNQPLPPVGEVPLPPGDDEKP